MSQFFQTAVVYIYFHSKGIIFILCYVYVLSCSIDEVFVHTDAMYSNIGFFYSTTHATTCILKHLLTLFLNDSLNN